MRTTRIGKVLIGGPRMTLAVASLLLSLASFPVGAADEDFYQGKKLTHIVDTSPGGAYDAYARLIDRFLGNHIPGQPSFVLQNMPGGGGRTAANWIYNIAPRDGTVLGTLTQGLAIDQLLSPEGIRFDAREFNWIGTPVVNNNTFVTWHTSGVVTFEDARKKEITVGSTGGSSPNQMYAVVANTVLGSKFKIIQGYKGGNDIDLAMERGELDGRAAISWQSLKGTHPDWLREHKVNILFQIGITKEPELPGVPLMIDLANNDEQRQILQFISSAIGMGRPTTTTPGVPPGRLALLRRAFDETVKDPAFLTEAKKQGLDINPESGTELQALVGKTVGISPQALAKIKLVLSGM